MSEIVDTIIGHIWPTKQLKSLLVSGVNESLQYIIFFLCGLSAPLDHFVEDVFDLSVSPVSPSVQSQKD